MAGRLATCTASAVASCSYPTSCLRRRSVRNDVPVAADCGGRIVCIGAEHGGPGMGCEGGVWRGRLRLRPAGLGSCLESTGISLREVAREVAVEVGGPRASKEQPVGVGDRVRVKGSLKVYHVGKCPDLDIDGLEGEVKEVLGMWNGKPVSANLPYKAQFFVQVEGKAVKFMAHLKDGEFELVNSASDGAAN